MEACQDKVNPIYCIAWVKKIPDEDLSQAGPDGMEADDTKDSEVDETDEGKNDAEDSENDNTEEAKEHIEDVEDDDPDEVKDDIEDSLT